MGAGHGASRCARCRFAWESSPGRAEQGKLTRCRRLGEEIGRSMGWAHRPPAGGPAQGVANAATDFRTKRPKLASSTTDGCCSNVANIQVQAGECTIRPLPVFLAWGPLKEPVASRGITRSPLPGPAAVFGSGLPGLRRPLSPAQRAWR